MTTIPDTRLHGYGRLDWQQVRTLLDGAACAWADLAGFHLDTVPSQAPPTSHLWAWWPDGTCARLRLDDSQAYAATLHPQPVDSTPITPTATETVNVHVRHATPLWGTSDPQAGPIPPELREYTWDLLEIPGAHPVTFVRATAPADSAQQGT